MKELTINQKTYPVVWDYSVVRLFCIRRGISLVSEYAQRISSIKFDESLTVENLEDLSYMVLSLIDRGVEKHGGQNDLTINDAFSWIYGNADNITQLAGLMSEATREVQKKTTKKKAH